MTASYPGQVTHRFELLRPLGAGGMAVVYEAIDRATGARLALKVLSAIDAVSRARFKREFRATQDLQHPNLVRLHELFEDGERLFFTMDLIDGVDFLAFVRGGVALRAAEDTRPLPAAARAPTVHRAPAASTAQIACDEARLRAGLAQLVGAVVALHDHGLVHRDIKPSNILVTQGGEVRLLDFGLISDVTVTPSTTRQLAGTAGYMAPEQVSSAAVGCQADWYSVGVLLFEALTGTLPFIGASADVIAHKRRYDAPPPRALVSGLPADLDRLCHALLSREPASRPDGRQVAAALGLAEHAPDARGTRPPPMPRVATGSFVGRADERRWLWAQYRRVRSDGIVGVSIQGESGIGKTALVRAFLDELRAAAPAPIVLCGRCYESESVAYKGVDGVVESLAAVLGQLPAEAAAALAPRHPGALALQFPALAALPMLVSGPQAASSGDPQAARTQAVRTLREILVRLAERAPLVIWIDDLQWIDADGRSVLNELLQPPAAPLALVLVARTVLAPGGKIEPLPCAEQTLSLGPLGQDDARALVAACAVRDGIALDARQARQLADEAQGHPIFANELVHHAAARDPTLPPHAVALEDVLWTRITELPPPSRALLELASVAGSPVPLPVVAAGARIDVAQAIACVAQLRVGRLVSTTGSGVNVAVQPNHDRVRRAVRARLDSGRTTDWHRAIAAAFEDTGTDDAEMLATHWSEAGEPVRAAPYAARAGVAAARVFAFERAAALFRVAVEGTADVELRRRLLAEQGQALANAGRGPDAARIFLTCAATATDPDEVLALRHRAADQLLRSGHVDEGLGVMRDLLGAVGIGFPRSPRASLVSLAYHRARLALRGLAYRQRAEADVAPAMLQRLDVCYSVASGLGMVDLVRGADFQSRCLLLALDAGEPDRLSRALAAEAIFTASDSWRSRRRAWPLIEAANALAERTDHPAAAGWVALARGIASLQDGRFDDGLRFSRDAEAIFRDRCPGAAWELARARAFTLWSLVLLGRLRELADRVPNLVRDSHDRGDWFAVMNLTAGPLHVLGLARDRAAEMRAECERGLAHWAQGGFHFQHLCALFTFVAADLYDGRAEDAVERVESTWKDVERSLLLRVQFFRLDLWALRGRAALAAAGHDAGSVHVPRVERAIARIERERMAWAEGHALALRAGLARLRGGLSDAGALLERAEQRFAASKMTVHAAACRLQRGRLLGAACADPFAQACALLEAEGVIRPSRFAATLVPLAERS